MCPSSPRAVPDGRGEADRDRARPVRSKGRCGDLPCHSVSGCSQVQPTSLLEPHRLRRIILARLPTGTVLSAEVPCTWWKGSPQPNCYCVLHLSPTYLLH